MIKLADLKTEIAKPAYAGMTDAEIAAAINNQSVAGFVAFSPIEAQLTIMLTASADWGWLVGVADGWITSANASGGVAVAVTPQTRRIAATLRDMFSLPLDVTIATQARATLLGNALSYLVAQNVIVGTTQSALAALATTNNPGWMKFGDRELDYNDIAQARAS